MHPCPQVIPARWIGVLSSQTMCYSPSGMTGLPCIFTTCTARWRLCYMQGMMELDTWGQAWKAQMCGTLQMIDVLPPQQIHSLRITWVTSSLCGWSVPIALAWQPLCRPDGARTIWCIRLHCTSIGRPPRTSFRMIGWWRSSEHVVGAVVPSTSAMTPWSNMWKTITQMPCVYCKTDRCWATLDPSEHDCMVALAVAVCLIHHMMELRPLRAIFDLEQGVRSPGALAAPSLETWLNSANDYWAAFCCSWSWAIETTPVLPMDCLAPFPKQIRTRHKGQKGAAACCRCRYLCSGCRCRCCCAFPRQRVACRCISVLLCCWVWHSWCASITTHTTVLVLNFIAT